MTTKQIIAKYGEPNVTGEGYLGDVILPYPMRIAWDKERKVEHIRCHKLIIPNVTQALTDVLSEYGYDKIVELGIDLYGGMFNYRKKIGGNVLSMHAWGLAIDLDPENNQLRWGRDRASFAKPEYKPLLEAFYKNGFINLGVEKNYDYMHFEIKS
jgi:hypothetical protein